MNKEKVTKWLNRMVKVTNQFCNVKEPYGVIQRCDQLRHKNDIPYVQMYKGLHEVAELLDLEVIVDYEEEDSVCYLFTYEGVNFIQLDHKDEEKM